ncbi:MarR family winged helix-turn-helix transcriptional regulator [Streptomyces sp. PTM05]|uniref:MarR family winged helix-turn-helix transcriptional regulator n=1 Tax=Streptantibioticus parmotrematis TaxID=2873249 RepID=A0ABS7QXG4_9ACTN|nr:MarR family winged helix-turn-helix transcriptional regulator [Streptantibioticus parmotrematis]MBY8887901.1 MarR family winged helix-turn-helix transcriptional regulator [Streptantibioticus parmotrematis]
MPTPHHPDDPNPAAPGRGGPDARLLTEVVTRLRRALRASIRTDYPWETLPMAQVELLQVLAEHSPARIGDLAARQRLATSTVSGLIGQMITSGLVARAVDPADRRASAVTLTDAGRDQLTAWAQAHERRLDAALDALDTDDRAIVRSALPALFRLAEHLDDTGTPDAPATAPDAPQAAPGRPTPADRPGARG